MYPHHVSIIYMCDLVGALVYSIQLHTVFIGLYIISIYDFDVDINFNVFKYVDSIIVCIEGYCNIVIYIIVFVIYNRFNVEYDFM